MAANAEQIAVWNGGTTRAWVQAPDRYDRMLEPLGRVALDAVALRTGEAVLDVGCGSGQFTRSAAAVVGTRGRVLGVDVAVPLLRLARERTTDDHVEYRHADAQVDDLGEGEFDAVVSRFGVMFFEDPVMAFGNLARATRRGGRLAFVCWQPLKKNAWALTAVLAVAEHLALPTPLPPGAPGPFAFGDPGHVRRVLTEAGWQDVMVEPVHEQLAVYGARTAAEAARAYREDAFGQALFASAAPEEAERAERALGEALQAHVGDDGVHLGAAAWLVTAAR